MKENNIKNVAQQGFISSLAIVLLGFDDCFAVCVRRAEVQNSTAVFQLKFSK